MSTTQKLEFEGSQGAILAARLDLPEGPIRAYAVFAHCFTCSKDLHATRRISQTLSDNGIAVLRFDFTGLGNSGGDFASTNFSSNKQDLLVAIDYLRQHFEAPSILIGHSLGGAAVLSIAGEVSEVKAVATIGAPAYAEHVVHNFGAKIDEIEANGEADVNLGGRTFSIRKQFLDDLAGSSVLDNVKSMKKALLVLHSPIDQTVGIENATDIFSAARHPKSFMSLDKADHLISSLEDANFVASLITSWAGHYIPSAKTSETAPAPNTVRSSETRSGKFQNRILTGQHQLLADEPTDVGGLESGPSPYEYLSSALAACTSMTLRMYADFKKLDIGRITVDVNHKKVHAADCEICTQDETVSAGKIDIFERTIFVDGLQDQELMDKLVAIADKCPVHKTLESGAKVSTHYSS